MEKVAVQRLPAEWLVTASPMKTVAGIAIVSAPNVVQVDPSAE